jgi:hypothetical protein
VANSAGQLPLEVELDGRLVPVQSGYWWSGGGAVLTIATVVSGQAEALEVISTYIGHPDTDTVVTHLVISGALSARVDTVSHPHGELNTVGLTRQCAYEHCNWLMDALSERGQFSRVLLGEDTFEQLESVG